MVAVSALILLVLHELTLDPTEPRFIPARDHFVPGKYSWMSYDFLSPSPFEGGKMWVGVGSSNEYHQFFFEIENRRILGELINAAPVFFNRDQNKLLCVQRALADTNAVRRVLMDLVARFSLSRRRIFHAGEDRESFWVIDLKHNSATRLGRAYQWPGAGSSFQPSPEFRHGFNKPTGSFNLPELFICDLEKDGFWKEPVDGNPVGWWDSQSILIKATNDDVVLYDVETRKTSPFLTVHQLRTFFAHAGLTNDPGAANAFFIWNGRENQFYLSDADKRWSVQESYLVKIDRPDGALKLLDPHFKFEWSDHFDADGAHYLYSGLKSGETNSAVYLRDTKTGRVRELAPPDPNHLNDFSIPRFYSGEVIYMRGNCLWQIGLDGNNNRRLFPPEGMP